MVLIEDNSSASSPVKKALVVCIVAATRTGGTPSYISSHTSMITCSGHRWLPPHPPNTRSFLICLRMYVVDLLQGFVFIFQALCKSIFQFSYFCFQVFFAPRVCLFSSYGLALIIFKPAEFSFVFLVFNVELCCLLLLFFFLYLCCTLNYPGQFLFIFVFSFFPLLPPEVPWPFFRICAVGMNVEDFRPIVSSPALTFLLLFV